MPENYGGNRTTKLTTDKKGEVKAPKVAKNKDGKGVQIRKQVMKEQESWKPTK